MLEKIIEELPPDNARIIVTLTVKEGKNPILSKFS